MTRHGDLEPRSGQNQCRGLWSLLQGECSHPTHQSPGGEVRVSGQNTITPQKLACGKNIADLSSQAHVNNAWNPWALTELNHPSYEHCRTAIPSNALFLAGGWAWQLFAVPNQQPCHGPSDRVHMHIQRGKAWAGMGCWRDPSRRDPGRK